MRLIDFLKDGGESTNWNSKPMEYKKAYVFQYLQSKGYTKNQSAAILGNLLQENDTLDPSRKNGIGATGIAQWLSKDRKSGLMSKDNPYSINTQLEYLHEEIQGRTGAWTNNVGGKKAFFNTDDVDKLTYIFRKDFERPGEHEANDSRRLKHAYNILGQKYDPVNLNSEFNSISYKSPPISYAQQDYINISPIGGNSMGLPQMDFNTLPKDTQEQYLENLKLQEDALRAEENKKAMEYENAQIEAALKQKQFERQQMMSMIPQAQIVAEQKVPNNYTTLLNNTPSQF